MRLVWQAPAVLQMCHEGGVASSGSVTNVSRGGWLALEVLQVCHAGGVASFGSVLNV